MAVTAHQQLCQQSIKFILWCLHSNIIVCHWMPFNPPRHKWEIMTEQQHLWEGWDFPYQMDRSQVWFCLSKGSQCCCDEWHFGPGWVSSLPVCNEPQWGWTPCSPAPWTVSTNELLNKSVLVRPHLLVHCLSLFSSPPPLYTRTRHLALSPYPVMSP